MSERLESDLGAVLTELVEKVGLLHRDLVKRGDYDKYEARVARIAQKVSALADRIERTDRDLARSLRTAWQQPGRSLAFRNAAHQRKPGSGSH